MTSRQGTEAHRTWWRPWTSAVLALLLMATLIVFSFQVGGLEDEPDFTPSSEGAAARDTWPANPSDVGIISDESDLTPSDSITTSFDGQMIESLLVTGRIEIIHDDVTVRDTKVALTTNYGLYVRVKEDGTCPVGVELENVEVDGSAADEAGLVPVYGHGCGYTMSHAYIHDTGQAVKVMGDTTIEDSYIVVSRSDDSDAHRNAIESRGSNNTYLRNYLVCASESGCSSALALYGFPDRVENVLVQENFLAANAGYCTYGGSTHSHPDAINVDYIDNAFSTMFHPQCGRAGFIAAHDNGLRGNEEVGNYVFETQQPLP